MALVYTSCDLFRAGNSMSARFDRLRIGEAQTGWRGLEQWISAKSGGVSTLEQPLGLAGPWYRLPRGTLYDDATFFLNNTYGGHWMWEAARDMRLADFVGALARLNQEFLPV